jgi:sporulation protein YlmC with PRC-barrel domain
MKMRVKKILGKTVIDAAGDELGKVDDIELNWEEKTVQNIIIKGDHEIKQKVMASKYANQLLKKIGAKADPDIVIDVTDIQSIGDVITLLIDII